MNPLRSVRGRLALALLVVVAGALGIVYVVVVTVVHELADRRSALNRLGMNLQRRRLGHRRRSTSTPQWAEEEAQPLADARVVVFQRCATAT